MLSLLLYFSGTEKQRDSQVGRKYSSGFVAVSWKRAKIILHRILILFSYLAFETENYM